MTAGAGCAARAPQPHPRVSSFIFSTQDRLVCSSILNEEFASMYGAACARARANCT
jgi:hypothetical protein